MAGKARGSVEVILTGVESLDFLTNPHSSVGRDRKRLVEAKLLAYAVPPERLDSDLNLREQKFKEWSKPINLGIYLVFYDRAVISRPERQRLLKSLRKQDSYQGEIPLE